MPEWPDVEIFKQYLDATSLHQKIRTVTVRSQKILKDTSAGRLRQALQGRSFESCTHYGKYLFGEVGARERLVIHFGMTGSLKYSQQDSRNGPHDRVVFAFDNGYKLAYVCQRLFGRIGLVTSVDDFLASRGQGPDAMSIDIGRFRRIFEKARGNVKSTLMNQKTIAGIGNIYSDEILFQAGINPGASCDKLADADVKQLYHNMKKVLKRAVERRADLHKLPQSYLVAHRNKGETCPRCHSKIRTRKIGGRTAFYCPNCQKYPHGR
jgi:formamidopyrimidine-DNA glycosylase